MSRCDDVRDALARVGLLLLQDKRLPSVVGIIAGRELSTSWWGLPEGEEIFLCLERLEPPLAMATRLVSRKVTFVHRRLWPALVAAGSSNEPWQRRGLSPGARRLLASTVGGQAVAATGAAARELQERLLVAAEEVHTPSGKHELRIENWPAWAARMKVRRIPGVSEARRQLDAAASALGASATALPWNRRRSPS